MTKFGRDYHLSVGTYRGAQKDSQYFGEVLLIEPPFTIEFDITRNTLTSANVCQIRIYNLSSLNRNQLRFDPMNNGDYRPVVLKAGYGDNLPTIFSGNVTQAWSVREGDNYITTIECFDGGYAFVNAITNIPFAAGTPYIDIIKTIAGSLPHTSLGAVGKFPGTLNRGNTYSGDSTSILSELSGFGMFIDNGKVNVLGNNEYIDNVGIPIIDASAGLLGTPIRENTILTFDMIFEPRAVVGQLVQLQSLAGGSNGVSMQGQQLTGKASPNTNFNGFYKIIGVKHRGMISESVCGAVITSLQMWWGTQSLTPVGAI